ncbi:uncharacterized protein LOC126823624 [Patella vulgata]|uniref:uncharacterized protein LOC126823624 n=1 Tax=Patella vulgata TaxID=6465 RepID=UPI0021801EEF|nr:uncharacterized protein LOC126823624 [Patella vulgata]
MACSGLDRQGGIVQKADDVDKNSDIETRKSKTSLKIQLYAEQKRIWPTEGKHILAQFDQETIVVYQAFNPSIAKYAVNHQTFGGPDYSFTRMSWIKTNFLWMMYRCGWAKKVNQQRVLAITISRTGFEEILSQAYTAKLQKSKGLESDKIEVRLQWDPDHLPTGEKELGRRAIQLGLKGETLRKLSSDWLVKIEDITEFVHQEHEVLLREGLWKIFTPSEQVYPLCDSNISQRIGLDFYDHKGPTVVKM